MRESIPNTLSTLLRLDAALPGTTTPGTWPSCSSTAPTTVASTPNGTPSLETTYPTGGHSDPYDVVLQNYIWRIKGFVGSALDDIQGAAIQQQPDPNTRQFMKGLARAYRRIAEECEAAEQEMYQDLLPPDHAPCFECNGGLIAYGPDVYDCPDCKGSGIISMPQLRIDDNDLWEYRGSDLPDECPDR